MNDNKTTLRVAEIQRFCMHDGPGVRTTVFFKGCPLRCVWCHNPEMQKSEQELMFFGNKCISCRLCASCSAHSFDGGKHSIDREKCVLCGKCADLCPTTALQICGRDMTVDEIVREVKKDVAFYGTNGGVTLSGGEPLAQAGVVDLLRAFKSDGINTAIETCGFYDVSAVLPYTDLFLWDIKDTDPARHEKYTGVSNGRILENLFAADEKGAKTRLRCIITRGVNANVDHYKRVNEIMGKLKNCTGADILPYHAYGGSKATSLGLPDNGDPAYIPTDDEINEATKIICG